MKIGEGGGADDEQEIEVLELKFDEGIPMMESGEIKKDYPLIFPRQTSTSSRSTKTTIASAP